MSKIELNSHPDAAIKRRTLIAGALILLAGGAAFFVFRHGEQPSSLFARGLREFHANDTRSLKETAAALGRFPDSQEQARLLQGAFLLRIRLFSDAVVSLSPEFKDPSLRVMASQIMGEALYRLGRFQDAEIILRKSLDDDPENVETHRWLAVSYYDLGASLQAAEHLSKVAALDQADGKPHRLLGLIHKDNEQFSEAVYDYRESMRRDSKQHDRDEILLELAQSLAKLNRFSEALEAVAVCPETPDFRAVKAECLYGEGRVPEATDAIAQGLKQAPGHFSLLVLQGTMELDSGNANAAASTLLRAIRAHPKEFSARYKLAQAYSRLGEKQKADEQMRIMRENKQLKARFAKLYQETLQDPQNAKPRYEMGVVALELGEPELARMWFRAALAIDPQHADARRAMDAIAR